jgi:phosphoribosylanthranilate isomerase
MVENEAAEMWGFKKTPPPPKKGVPTWVIQLITPLVFALFMGLVTFIGSGFSEDIKDLKTQVETVDKEKVDNQTLQLMIKNQELLIKHQQQEAEMQREQDAEKFEQIQRTQTKTLERIEAIQAPSKVRVMEAVPMSAPKKEPLSPEEFEKYMSMEPDIQIKYKRYLEKIGKDVSGLP